MAETAVQAVDFHTSKVAWVVVKGFLDIYLQSLSLYKERVSKLLYN